MREEGSWRLTRALMAGRYTEFPEVTRGRALLANGKKEWMLYTERLHFYRRLKLKSVGHVIFYQLPHWAGFYPELLNPMEGVDTSCTVLFSRYASIVIASGDCSLLCVCVQVPSWIPNPDCPYGVCWYVI